MEGIIEKNDYIEFTLSYEDEEEKGLTLIDLFKEYFKNNEICKYENLIIGAWEECYEESPKEAIDFMIGNKNLFPNLKNLFVGNMDYERCEVSWITLCDLGQVLNTFELEEFKVKGSVDLRLKDVKSDSLKTLSFINGGLGSDVLEDVKNAKLKNLTKLDMYLGVEDYGFDGSIEDIKPFMDKILFPNLKYLGLKNSGIQDEICEAVLKSNILEQLEVLDMSLGILSDKSGELILKNIDKLKHLKKFDIHFNYIKDSLLEELRAEFENTNVEFLCDRSNAQDYMDEENDYDDEDYDYRFPYMTE